MLAEGCTHPFINSAIERESFWALMRDSAAVQKPRPLQNDVQRKKRRVKVVLRKLPNSTGRPIPVPKIEEFDEESLIKAEKEMRVLQEEWSSMDDSELQAHSSSSSSSSDSPRLAIPPQGALIGLEIFPSDLLQVR